MVPLTIILTSRGGTTTLQKAGRVDCESIRKLQSFGSCKSTMADPEEQATPIEDEEPEETPGYKPPAQKTLDEIQKLDADDESLVRYKQMLLAGAEAAGRQK